MVSPLPPDPLVHTVRVTPVGPEGIPRPRQVSENMSIETCLEAALYGSRSLGPTRAGLAITGPCLRQLSQ